MRAKYSVIAVARCVRRWRRPGPSPRAGPGYRGGRQPAATIDQDAMNGPGRQWAVSAWLTAFQVRAASTSEESCSTGRRYSSRNAGPTCGPEARSLRLEHDDRPQDRLFLYDGKFHAPFFFFAPHRKRNETSI